MDSKESMLEIQNLHVVYKTDLETVYAVNGLTFSLQKGQTLGLVGETGAGKTTLALTIMGLLPERTGKVTQGAVRFEGEDLIHLSEKNMRHVRGNKIAMIFQDPMTSLNPVLTVGEQIAEALIVHNEAGLTKAEIDARVDETLRMVGIPPARKNEYPHQFSGGMRQRVMIAIALSCEPDLLIADEPTTALDVTIQAQVLLMIRNLRDRLGTSLIMVMYLGQCLELSTSDELFKRPLHPYTQALLSAIPEPDISMRNKEIKVIQGEVVSPVDPKPGCRFAARCEFCTELCTKDDPPLLEVSPGHHVACHLLAPK